MSDPSPYDRFEELEAGRLLGDLDEHEQREWEELSERFAGQSDGSLEAVTAALEVDFATESLQSLPADLADSLGRDARAFESGRDSTEGKIVRGSFPIHVLQSTKVAWGAAAVLAGLLLITTATKVSPPDDPKTTQAPLEQRATDVLSPAFTGVGPYEDVSGRVVWSDELQEGYMQLTNLPPNDPTKNQYQLWIVDPDRAKQPVDGGVFDVDSSGGVRVPIDAKLAVNQPKAFVITLEQPGGVVVSDQQTVVAMSRVDA